MKSTLQKMNGGLQKFGKSLLLPIALIAAAGMFLGLAAALQNPDIVGQGFANTVGIQNFIGFVRYIGNLIFGNLPIFFAISVAVGLAKEEKGTAVFAAVIGFLAFNATISYILGLHNITADTTTVDYLMQHSHMSVLAANFESAKYTTVLGFFTYNMSIVSGVISGLVVAWLHNRFYKIKLPMALDFFGGKRFVPLITVVVLPIFGLAFYYIWPVINEVINALGTLIQNAGPFGPFIYGFTNHLMIPTGLHNIVNQLIRFTPIGGIATIAGKTYVGGLNIFNQALITPDVPRSILELGAKYQGQGHMITVMFGLPAAGLAMIHESKPENRIKVTALVVGGMLASFTTGITEPLEYLFIFISPILFLFHAFMYGLGYFLASLFHVAIGGVQGGFIDFVIFGVLQGTKIGWPIVLVLGLLWGVIYYFGFRFLIRKFNIKTPGREGGLLDGSDDSEVNSTNSLTSGTALSEKIVEGLGGKENITIVENCMTRLRVWVKNPELIDEKVLQSTGTYGFVYPTPDNIQVVYGTKVDTIASDVKSFLGME